VVRNDTSVIAAYLGTEESDEEVAKIGSLPASITGEEGS
jgi:hypothetical protein